MGTVARGLTGIITRPVKGAMEGGVGGAIKGFRQGVVGVVIMIPLAYIGFAERFYKGMGATFQAKGKLSVCGTRRPPRIMRSLRKRKQLKDREREKRMESTHTSQRKQRRSLTIDNHTGKKGSALSSAATDLYLLQQTLKNPTTNKSKSKVLNCFNGEGIGDVDQAPEETEIADEEGQAVMQRLFDVDDASLASHVTMRIHKIKNVMISANSKIVVRVNLYTQQSAQEVKDELSITHLSEDMINGDHLHSMKKKSQKLPWLKLQSYMTSPGTVSSFSSSNNEMEFSRDDFTFHLDRMTPTSEDLQKYLIRGCSLQKIKFKIKIYEMHTLSKTLLAETELHMTDLLSIFPVRDPEPFKAKHDSSAGAKPNLAWTHISDSSDDKRRVTADRLMKLKKKKSMRVRSHVRSTHSETKETKENKQDREDREDRDDREDREDREITTKTRESSSSLTSSNLSNMSNMPNMSNMSNMSNDSLPVSPSSSKTSSPMEYKTGNDHEHFAFGGHLSNRERKYNSNHPSPYDGSDTDSESSQIKGMGSFLKR